MFKDVMIEGLEERSMYEELVDKRKIFKRLIDVFFVAAIIGFLKCNYVEKNEKDPENRKRIPQSAFINNINSYGMIINTIVLLHYYRTGEGKDKILNVFNDSDENWNVKLNIVEKYARGGINNLYDEIIGKDSTNIDDSVENINNLINNFQKKYKLSNDIENQSFEETLKKVLE